MLHSGPVHLHLEQQHMPRTESVYFDLDNVRLIDCKVLSSIYPVMNSSFFSHGSS